MQRSDHADSSTLQGALSGRLANGLSGPQREQIRPPVLSPAQTPRLPGGSPPPPAWTAGHHGAGAPAARPNWGSLPSCLACMMTGRACPTLLGEPAWCRDRGVRRRGRSGRYVSGSCIVIQLPAGFPCRHHASLPASRATRASNRDHQRRCRITLNPRVESVEALITAGPSSPLQLSRGQRC